jgi:ubiquinone/menaquinone biosynthesis C-methylase UbiE
MSLLVQRRRPSREWLDDSHRLPISDIRKNLEDLRSINTWGGAGTLERHLDDRIRALASSGGPVRILDVGAGSGDVAGRLQRGLRGRGHRATVVALELRWRHLRTGRAMTAAEATPAAPALAGDAFRLPFADASFDLAISTLFFHHFSPEQNRTLLGEMWRVAPHGVALLDLRRHRAPALFVSLAGPLFFRSRVSVHDGLASVNQAYTASEALSIARGTVPLARVRRVFPFRWLLTSGA